MNLGQLVDPAVFVSCLLLGPIVVAKLFPERTGVRGDRLAGTSGMSPIFWGTPAGLIAASTILMIINPGDAYTSELDRLQNTVILYVILVVLSAPLLIWGANVWTWDADGLSFRGLFRRKKVRWSEITRVAPAQEGGCTIAVDQKVVLRTSRWISGNQLILAALYHYRKAAFH